MKLNEYQDIVKSFAHYQKYNINDVPSYLGLAISGEAGEIADKLKKHMRGDYNINDEGKRRSLALEIGDVLWGLSELARYLDFTLEDIAKENIKKMEWREATDKMQGDGDSR